MDTREEMDGHKRRDGWTQEKRWMDTREEMDGHKRRDGWTQEKRQEKRLIMLV